MQGLTHLLTGAFLGFLFLFLGETFFVFTVVEKIILIVFVVLGSLLPDIDIATSFLGRKTKLIGYLFTHRGFFHSVLFLLLISIIVGEIFFFLAGVCLFLGMSSHLLLDALSAEGLILYPFRKRLAGPFVVGGILEKILQLLLVALLVFLLI